MIMRECCYIILAFVMATTMSMTSYAQNTTIEHDTALSLKPSKMIEAVPAKNNEKVIKRYNRYHHKAPIKPYPFRATGYTAVFGVKKNSVMSTDDIEVNFIKKWMQDPVYSDMDNRMYFVEICNKSDETIYIDKANCYRVYNNGMRQRYFAPNENGSNSAERVITIPPHKKKNLCEYDVVLTQNEGCDFKTLKINDYPEDFNWDSHSAGVHEGFLRMYEVRSFSEENSPYHRTYLITYSKDEHFSTYTLLPINFYMRQLIGNYYPELYQGQWGDFELFGGDEYTITNAEYAYDNHRRGSDRVGGLTQTLNRIREEKYSKNKQ